MSALSVQDWQAEAEASSDQTKPKTAGLRFGGRPFSGCVTFYSVT